MYVCKVCLKSFDKATGDRAYTSYCSSRCFNIHWKKNNREKYLQSQKHVWRRNVSQFGCSICGFKRALDKCHIKWRKDGGKVSKDNIVILCPNHHRLFDQNKLTEEEKLKIKSVKNL